MSETETNKLIARNAALWSAASLLSFVFPLIVDSMMEGKAGFLGAMVQVAPLFVAIPISSGMIKKSVGKSVD